MKQNTMTFRNVHIRYLDIRRKEESMPFVRLHLTADLSTTVAEAMGWAMPGEGTTDGSLVGKLTGSHMILTPNEKGLKDRELQIECSDVSDFQFTPGSKSDEGRITSYELRFIARSNQETAAAVMEQFWRAVGDSDCAMRLAYTKQPEQTTLEMPAETPQQQVAMTEDEHTPPAPGGPGDPDDWANADNAATPALASAMAMGQRRRGADAAAKKVQ